MQSKIDQAGLVAACKANHHPDIEPSSVELRQMANSIRAYLAASPPATDRAGVKVKPLEWQRQHDELDEAISPFGPYQVRAENDGTFWWEFRGQGIEHRGLNFRTKDKAKAAAQADYDTRIRSALTQPDGEADALREALRGLVLLLDLFEASDRTHKDAFFILAQQPTAWERARAALTSKEKTNAG